MFIQPLVHPVAGACSRGQRRRLQAALAPRSCAERRRCSPAEDEERLACVSVNQVTPHQHGGAVCFHCLPETDVRLLTEEPRATAVKEIKGSALETFVALLLGSSWMLFLLNIWVTCTQTRWLHLKKAFESITELTPATSSRCRHGDCCCWSHCRSSAGSMRSPLLSDAATCSSVGAHDIILFHCFLLNQRFTGRAVVLLTSGSASLSLCGSSFLAPSLGAE